MYQLLMCFLSIDTTIYHYGSREFDETDLAQQIKDIASGLPKGMSLTSVAYSRRYRTVSMVRAHFKK